MSLDVVFIAQQHARPQAYFLFKSIVKKALLKYK